MGFVCIFMIHYFGMHLMFVGELMEGIFRFRGLCRYSRLHHGDSYVRKVTGHVEIVLVPIMVILTNTSLAFKCNKKEGKFSFKPSVFLLATKDLSNHLYQLISSSTSTSTFSSASVS